MNTLTVEPTFRPIKVVDVELSQPLPNFTGLKGYEALQVLLRLQGAPIAYLRMPLPNGSCSAADLGQAILAQHSWCLIRHLSSLGIGQLSKQGALSLDALLRLPALPEAEDSNLPLVTVAVCTRDRPDDVRICLDALLQLDYPYLDFLVIDNAPSNTATEDLILHNYPQVRYIQEECPGVSWARNRAIIDAQGEIIAYADDDVVVDPNWVRELVRVYQEIPDAMAVTGLVPPYELETEAQILFEKWGGFGRGFERKTYRSQGNKVPWYLLGTGEYGTGANMSFRRSLFTQIDGFNPFLSAGEDLELFFRVVKAGYAFVYEPKAISRHRHRREYQQLRKQLSGYGVGIYAYHTCGFLNYPVERWSFLFLGLWWLWYGNIRRLWVSWKYPNRFPRDLILAEFMGCFKGVTHYLSQVKRVQDMTERPSNRLDLPLKPPQQNHLSPKRQQAMAVRTLELSQPPNAINHLDQYDRTKLYITWQGHPIGHVEIANEQRPIYPKAIGKALFDSLELKLANPSSLMTKEMRWVEMTAHLREQMVPAVSGMAKPPALSSEISVSVVVATYDRPDSLRSCLRCLMEQNTDRVVEIIVVDNHPSSGQTPPIVAEFPGVTLVKESRRGLAYARNAGIVVSTGAIIVATDDDVTMPPQWLEALLVPFNRLEVMVVTGQVLPLELDTRAQQLFESYGGLGRGFQSLEVNGDWFEQFPRQPVPTWTLGATANAAFRASIFSHPCIGLMDEALGPGMPSGVGEDTYLFYKVLKAGYTLIYNPKVYVWHQHRCTMAALRKQIYNYSKGHVAYNLTTWLQDGDWRGLAQVLIGLPYAHYNRIKKYLTRRSDYPISLILLEMAGNLAGPWSLWRSRVRVRKEGQDYPFSKRQSDRLSQTSAALISLPEKG